MFNTNAIILKKTNFTKINYITLLTPSGKIKAIAYGRKQLNLLYLFNVNLKETLDSKELFVVSNLNLLDRFESLNTKEKLHTAFFILEIANQINIDFNFFIETISLLKTKKCFEVIQAFIQTVLKQNGIYNKTEYDFEQNLNVLENYIGKKLFFKGTYEIFNSAR